jgi:hypothetical protein
MKLKYLTLAQHTGFQFDVPTFWLLICPFIFLVFTARTVFCQYRQRMGKTFEVIYCVIRDEASEIEIACLRDGFEAKHLGSHMQLWDTRSMTTDGTNTNCSDKKPASTTVGLNAETLYPNDWSVARSLWKEYNSCNKLNVSDTPKTRYRTLLRQTQNTNSRMCSSCQHRRRGQLGWSHTGHWNRRMN